MESRGSSKHSRRRSIDTAGSVRFVHKEEAVTVTAISSYDDRGFYAPMTASGSIVVNGVVASTFAEGPEGALFQSIGSMLLAPAKYFHWFFTSSAPKIASVHTAVALGTITHSQ